MPASVVLSQLNAFNSASPIVWIASVIHAAALLFFSFSHAPPPKRLSYMDTSVFFSIANSDFRLLRIELMRFAPLKVDMVLITEYTPSAIPLPIADNTPVIFCTIGLAFTEAQVSSPNMLTNAFFTASFSFPNILSTVSFSHAGKLAPSNLLKPSTSASNAFIRPIPIFTKNAFSFPSPPLLMVL